MAPAVLLHSAVVLTGRFPALAGVDLTVETGEVVVLEGANGAGKTTLLRLCAGLLPLGDGEGTVLGCDLRRDAAAVRPRVGLFSAGAALYDDLTVDENVRFFARAGVRRGRGPRGAGSAAAGSVEASLERLGLGGRLRRTPVGRLSTGQRRRVALAVVVARAPALWLLDEPHASLDAEARAVVDVVVADAAAAGATVLMASHEREVSGALADRVVTLGGGRVRDQRAGGRAPVAAPLAVAVPTGRVVHVA